MPKTPLSFYLHMIAVAVIVFAVGNYVSSRTPDRAEGSPSIISGDSSTASRNDNRESAYDRVMRTKTIRCGYIVWDPMVAKDVNTGAMSGVLYDYINELGRSLDLKVEWAQELNFATYVTDINSGKYDIECTGGWPSAAMGKFVEYTQPIFYFPVIAFVRLDDTRFDKSLNTINDPSIKVVSIDNDVASRILKRNFPNAGVVSMPQMGSEVSTQLMMVATGKADLAFVNYSGGLDFIKSNPGKIKPILHTPAQVIAANISVGANENRLKDMLNAASQELSNSGFVEALLTKYEKYPGSFYRVAKPYQLTAN